MSSHTEDSQAATTWEIARRRWVVGLVAFLLPLSAVVGLAVFLPSVFRASTIVLVDRQQVPEAFVRSTVTSGLEARLQRISEEVLKRTRLEELIQRFNLYPELRARRAMEAAAERMRQDVKIEQRTDPVVRGGAIVAFTVSYTGQDPATVAAVANTIASIYLTENIRVREQEASGTASFLRKQLEEVKDRLEGQEARVSVFKRRYIGENPKNMDANLAVLERLTAQLRLNSDNQNRALERREALGRQLAGSEGTVPVVGVNGIESPDPVVVRLARLHHELVELQTRFSDKYPDVLRLKGEIAALEAQAQGSPVTGPGTERRESAPNPFAFKLRQAIAETEAEIAALRGEEGRLREDFATYQRRVENTPLREQEFQELSRDYETTTELYRTLLKRYEEAQLAETLEQRQKGEQFRILEAAIPPTAPSAPNRFRLFLVGTVLSAALAVGVALLVERLDRSFHDVDDLRSVTNVPVIGRIPRIVNDADRSRGRLRAMAVACTTAVAMALMIAAVYATARGHVPIVSRVAQGLLLRS